MELASAAGLVTAVGSLMFIFALTPLTGLYGGRDPDQVIGHIKAHWRAYMTSQVLFAIGAITTGVGLALLSVRLAEGSGPLLPALAALAVLAGSVTGAARMYDRTVNYERFFREYGHFPITAWAWLTLTGMGLLSYGLIFLAPGSANWLGYLTLGLTLAMIVGAIAIPKLVPPQIYYVATLVIGAVAFLSPDAIAGS
jgi:hypothetical protein